MKKVITVIFLGLMLCSCFSREQTEEICILYTNDVASEVNGDIGYAGVKYFKDEMTAEYGQVALVDAGDYYDGELAVISDGHYILDLMNLVGYDVVTLGNQEFSIGLDALADNIANSAFDTVSCNLRYLGIGEDPLKEVKPYVIKKFGHTRIAFIGVTTPETLIENKPAYDAITRDGELLYSFYEGNAGEDLYKQVQKTIDKVRNKADYVIVIAHLGSNSTQEGYNSYDLISHTSGIDVLIDGHSHTQISGEAVADRDGRSVVLTSTGQKLETIGQLIIHTDHTYTTTLYRHVNGKDPGVQLNIDTIGQ